MSVEAERVSSNVYNSRYSNLNEYVCSQQPRQIKQDINKTISTYKKKGKKYVRPDLNNTRNYLEKRFKLNVYTNTIISGYAHQYTMNCILATEAYLEYRINKVRPKLDGGFNNSFITQYKSMYGSFK